MTGEQYFLFFFYSYLKNMINVRRNIDYKKNLRLSAVTQIVINIK